MDTSYYTVHTKGYGMFNKYKFFIILKTRYLETNTIDEKEVIKTLTMHRCTYRANKV